MAGKEIIICIDNNRVHFNSLLSIPIKNTNIPNESLTFRSHEKILWKVEMVEYIGIEKCLKVRVLEYQHGNFDIFDKQEPQKPINKLLFEKFDWPSLEPLLSSYQKIHLTSILSNIDSNLFSNGQDTHIKHKKLEPLYNTQLIDVPVEGVPNKIEDEFWLNISDTQFKLGYVAFSKRIKGIDTIVEFKILNDHLLAEFENVKFWFAKILKTKKIKVLATVTLKGTTIIDSQATSVHIDKITPELIDSVKYQRTFGLTKPSKIKAIDKSLFTAEDIFNQFESEEEGNAFKQSDFDILSLLLEKPNIRNKKQLHYIR